jgi:hypothetical protein
VELPAAGCKATPDLEVPERLVPEQELPKSEVPELEVPESAQTGAVGSLKTDPWSWSAS